MKSLKYILLLIFINHLAMGQELLTKEEAVSRALEFNYDIKVAKNNVEVAHNLASPKNNNYLPTISAQAGTTYSDSKVKRDDEDGFAINNSGSVVRMNSSLNLNYTIFDGMGRKYIFERAKHDALLTELQARQITEGALVQLFVAYHEVARLTENEIIQRQGLDISKGRLLRAQYGFDYGQGTQLDVLNAEVDVNTDSINYLTIVQQLGNSKRDLNLLLGRNVDIAFEVDTTVTYAENIDINALREEVHQNNVNILQINEQIISSEYDIGISKSGWVPKIGATASYGWTRSDFEESSNFTDITTNGPSAGVSLIWNIFDGGATSTQVQNAKITLQSQQIVKERAQQQLDRNLNNAWTTYQTSLFILEAQRKNLETSRRNFERTVEQNKFGQVTSIEFRQAQVNLLNAALIYSEAKYSAKNAELALLQLSGHLLDSEF
ncbi:MAG: transporter [Cyclobacteriaceae bacterium]|nr:MAG: transporter [Cyclobacteriaceae bacterium]